MFLPVANFSESSISYLDFSFSRIYSLRKVVPTATRSIRIRRSSDNTETDIGFVDNNLDTTAISSFCGASTGTIQVFYDQSSNGINATFSTAGGAVRGTIYSGGSVLTTNGKPSASMGLRSTYEFSALNYVDSCFFVAKNNTRTSNVNNLLYGNVGSLEWSFLVAQIFVSPSGGISSYYYNSGTYMNTIPSYSSTQRLASFVWSATASLFVINDNGSADSFGTPAGGTPVKYTDKYYVNRLSGNLFTDQGINGTFQEVLVGATGSNINLSNKNTIIKNMNSYWRVY